MDWSAVLESVGVKALITLGAVGGAQCGAQLGVSAAAGTAAHSAARNASPLVRAARIPRAMTNRSDAVSHQYATRPNYGGIVTAVISGCKEGGSHLAVMPAAPASIETFSRDAG